MNLKITSKTAGVRLDKFLAASGRLKNLSRSQIQKLVKQNLITINGQAATAHYSLKPGDIIKIITKPAVKTDRAVAKKSAVKAWIIPIVDETEDFLVINKPAGLVVHGAADYTLADWLIKKFPGLKKIGEDAERPGIVHRLDKDVSGLMVIAKTQPSFKDLKRQFQDREINKEYTGLAYGQIKKDAGVINFPIKRSAEGYKMAALPLTVKGQPSQDGRQAETRFTVLKSFINYTLLKLKIITGRTHQIRVHLAAYDHPLAGDGIYGTAKTRRQNLKLDLKRVFLVADRLGFTDLNGEHKNYKINLPAELKALLKQIK